MNKRTRGCLWAGLGVAVLLVIVGVGVVGGAAWLVYQGSSIEQAHPTADQAKVRFEQARQRFGGQAPLVTMGSDGAPRVTPRTRSGPPPGGKDAGLETFHVMAWTPENGELTHVQLPFWLLRLGGAKGRLIAGGDMHELERLRLSVEDIERAGPGLLFDHVEQSGQRVLIWTE